MDAEGHAPTVFLCCHPANQEWLDRFVVHLQGSRGAGDLKLWHGSRIQAGDDWGRRFDQAVDESRLAVLLISPDFLGSEDEAGTHIREEQVPRMLGRRSREGLHMIPVIVRPCLWQQVDWLRSIAPWDGGRTWKADDDQSFVELAGHILESAYGPPPVPRPHDLPPPYRGLESFGVRDADHFFGREALVDELVEKIRSVSRDSSENRCLAIVGSSGSGKSSLARAGLLVALEKGKIEASEAWPRIDLEPGHEPLTRLGRKILALEGEFDSVDLDEKASELAEKPWALHRTAQFLLDEAPPERRLLVLVDQCEELFTQTLNQKEREAFLANLHHAATVPGGRTVVVLTLRGDFFDDFMKTSAEARKLLDHQTIVGPLSTDELRDAIEKPMHRQGGEIEPGLVEILLNDVKGQEDSLPLLQYTLSELWRRRDRHRLTVKTYREIGGLARAVEATAERTFSGLDEATKKVCREIFVHLVRLTETERYTRYSRRRVDIRELVQSAGDKETVERVLGLFIKERLLTSTGTETASSVEVTHEALVNYWSRSRKWLERETEYLRVQKRVEEDADEWYRNDHEPSFLYRGRQLTDARKHIQRLPEKARDFLEAAETREAAEAREAADAREAAEAREAGQKLALFFAASIIIVLALLAGFAWHYERSLGEYETLAKRSKGLVGLKPRAAMLVAVLAQRLARESGLNRLPEAENTLRKVLAQASGEPFGAPGERIMDVLVRDDSLRMTTRIGDHELRVRDVGLPLAERQGELLCAYALPTDQIHQARLSAEGDHVTVIAGTNAERHLLEVTEAGCEEKAFAEDRGDASAGRKPGEVDEGFRGVLDEASRWLQVAGESWTVAWLDDFARLWDRRSAHPERGPEPRIFEGYSGDDVRVLAESGEGRFLTAGTRSPPQVRDLDGGPGFDLRCPGGAESGWLVALSSNRRWLALANGDGSTICRWELGADVPVGEPPLKVPEGLGRRIVRIGINHDGKRLAVFTDDGVPRSWPVERPEDVTMFRGFNSGTEYFFVLSSDDLLATGSDREIRLVNQEPRDWTTSLIAAGPEVPARWLVYGGLDSGAHLLDLASDSQEPTVLTGPERPVTAAAFSSDGSLLAVGDDGGEVRLWDLEVPEKAILLGDHRIPIRDLTFFSDDASLASVDARGTLHLWTIGVERLEEIACRVAGRDLDESEFRDAVGDILPYRSVCP